MVAINSLLLSIFAKNFRFGPDAKSSLRRNQTLAIIYCCIAFCLKVVVFEVALLSIFSAPRPLILTSFAVLASLIGLVLLRSGRSDLAVINILMYLQIIDFAAASYYNQPTAALHCLFPILQVAFFMTSSTTIRIFNTLACFLQATHHIFKMLTIFKVTLNEEQFGQIPAIIIASSSSLALCAVGCFLQSLMEAQFVEVAEKNYKSSENLNKELVQAVDGQEKFLFSLNHEIRNSLNSLSGSIEYLLDTVKNLSHLKVLRNAKLSSEILLNLVNNILDAAKLKSDKVDIIYREASLDEVIKKAFTINSESLKAANIFAESLIDQNVPRKLWIDPSKLLQILMNLISNAIKFTPKGGQIHINVTWHPSEANKADLLAPNQDLKTIYSEDERGRNLRKMIIYSSGRIASPHKSSSCKLDTTTFEEFVGEEEQRHSEKLRSLKRFKVKALTELNNSSGLSFDNEFWTIHRAHILGGTEAKQFQSTSSSQMDLSIQMKGYLKIEVLDTGCGINQESMPKLFTMFAQGNIKAASTQRGTGLGLWISKQLCETMGGDIIAYSQINHGSKFVFYIPVNNEALIGKLPKQMKPRSKTIKALVVDDFAFNRDLHKLLLEREGVHVTLASDGKEAFEKYKNKGEDYFDFVMTDVQMPVMDGFTSAKKIREWEKARNEQNVDIYFISGEYFNEDDVMAEFRTKGAIDGAADIRCLRKPIDVERLKMIVEKYRR